MPSGDLPPPFRDRPFRYADALAAGLSHKLLRGPRFRAPFRGVRVPAHLEDTLELRAGAASLVLPPSAAFADETAAELLRLPLRASQLHARVPVGVTVPRLNGIRATSGLDPSCVVTVQGLPVVAPARLFVDMARRLKLVELVAFGDAILNGGLATTDALAAAVQACAGARWITRARAALPHLEPRAESPMESRFRMQLVLGGLPRPVAGQDIVVDEAWLARPDLQYPTYRLAMEYDGDTHRTDRHQWRDDIFRKEVLEDYGWRCLVFTADDVLRRRTLTTDRVRRALMARGWRPPSCP